MMVEIPADAEAVVAVIWQWNLIDQIWSDLAWSDPCAWKSASLCSDVSQAEHQAYMCGKEDEPKVQENQGDQGDGRSEEL